MDEFLSFRKMITPMIVQVLFWILVGVSVLGGLGMMIAGFAGAGIGLALVGLFYIVLGPVFVRIYCELLILFFRIHETLVEIKANTAPRV